MTAGWEAVEREWFGWQPAERDPWWTGRTLAQGDVRMELSDYDDEDDFDDFDEDDFDDDFDDDFEEELEDELYGDTDEDEFEEDLEAEEGGTEFIDDEYETAAVEDDLGDDDELLDDEP